MAHVHPVIRSCNTTAIYLSYLLLQLIYSADQPLPAWQRLVCSCRFKSVSEDTRFTCLFRLPDKLKLYTRPLRASFIL